MLRALQDHKDFLFGIFQSVDPKWVLEQEERRRRKKSEIKAEWVAHARRNPEQFLDDDQFLSEFSKPADGGQTSHGGSKLDATVTSLSRGRRGAKPGPKEMTDEDWANKFEELLDADLIDVPEDYYDEPIRFDDADQLMQIFTSLEEKNLEIIKKSQDTEYSLEIRKQEEIRTQKEIGGMINQLQHNAQELVEQISQAQAALNELKKANKQAASGEDQKKKKPPKDAAGAEEDEPDIEGLMAELRTHIEKIYKYLEGNQGAALDAKASIEILQEIEIKLNEHMKLIKYVHDYGYDFHQKVKHLVEARRSAKQSEVRAKINEEIRKKNE